MSQQATSGTGHLPGCEAITLRTICETSGTSAPDHLHSRLDDIAVLKCEQGCPILERTLERGRELAEEHGWVTHCSGPPAVCTCPLCRSVHEVAFEYAQLRKKLEEIADMVRDPAPLLTPTVPDFNSAPPSEDVIQALVNKP